MALKRKISKEAFDKLSEDIKAEYKEQDGEYVLDIDGDEDTGALKRAKDREAQLRRDAEKRAKEAEEKLQGLKATTHANAATLKPLKSLGKRNTTKQKPNTKKGFKSKKAL